MRFRLSVLFSATFLLLAAAVRAQDFPPSDPQADLAPPAHIAYVDGRVTLDRETDSDAAAAGLPLVPGDRVRTEQGRAEILFPDGTALDLDEFSSIELQAPNLLRVFEGRVLLIVSGSSDPGRAADFHIDTPIAGVDTYGPGEYRLTLLNGRSGLEAELAVVRGSAALTGDRGSLPIRAGERSSVVANGTPSDPLSFNSARFDAFDRWVDMRRDDRRGVRSAQYLPDDLRMYGGVFDRDGSWAYDAQYGGYVWYPAVAPDWRPYYDGYWAPVPSYGWMWVGGARWAWPTHHYGRWGINGARWYWIPDRRFASAWVSWGSAPGYVGWSPLGFNNRPVFSLNVSVGNRWNGWVVVPRDRFGSRRSSVRQWAVPPDRFPRTTFAARAAAPVPAPRIAGRGDYGAAGRRPGPGDRQWQPRPQATRDAGSIRMQRSVQPNGVTIYSNRAPAAQGVRGGAERQPERSESPRYAIPATSDRSANGIRRTDRRDRDATAPIYQAPSASRPSPEHAPTIGALPRGARRSADAPSAPSAPSRAPAPMSPAYAPPPSAPAGSTLPTYQRRETPQYSPPPTAARPADARPAERPRYQREGGGARQDDGGGRRAVPRDRGSERPASGGGASGGSGQSSRGESQPRGARRGR